MLIGVPTEVKPQEYRVGMTPGSAREAIRRGHGVLVQSGAAAALGIQDEAYRRIGAEVADSAEEVFARAEMVVKVKEPQLPECARLREGQILFTYLHLAAAPDITGALRKSGAAAIAYETITSPRGGLPLLAPMSEIAGRLSVHAGAHALEIHQGGRGVLLAGAPGVAPGKVVILGGGVAGANAARMAVGLGAQVTILDINPLRLRELDMLFGAQARTLFSSLENLEQAVFAADLTIGAVLIPGAAAPKLITAAMLDDMKFGAVVVDIAIDQGGCFETSRPTTHEAPTYRVGHVVHYCVANMPGAVANTSTQALNNATLPYILSLADAGVAALRDDEHFRNGLNVFAGHITHPAVAQATDAPCTDPLTLLPAP